MDPYRIIIADCQDDAEELERRLNEAAKQGYLHVQTLQFPAHAFLVLENPALARLAVRPPNGHPMG